MFFEVKPRALLVAILGCALLWAVSADAQKQMSGQTPADGQKETVIQSDENGEITLTQPTKVGDLTLQPASYVLQLHESRGQHLVRFMKAEETRKLLVTRAYTGWHNETELIKAGDVKCRVEPLSAKSPASTVKLANENGTLRITQATIKGKAAVYVF